MQKIFLSTKLFKPSLGLTYGTMTYYHKLGDNLYCLIIEGDEGKVPNKMNDLKKKKKNLITRKATSLFTVFALVLASTTPALACTTTQTSWTTSNSSYKKKTTNNAPVTTDYAISIDKITAVSGKVVATDADKDKLTYCVTTSPSYGKATVDSRGNFKYTPNTTNYRSNKKFTDNDTFKVTVKDSKCASAISTVTITLANQAVSTFTIDGTIRDFKSSHPDFENYLGNDRGIALDTLGADKTPVYNSGKTHPSVKSLETYNQWYHDVSGVNAATPYQLILTKGADGNYNYSNKAFFPIDSKLFGNERNKHNYHFTMETHTYFTYKEGQKFSVTGDDDILLFINDKLVVDLGGTHTAQTATVNADTLGLVPGKTYTFDLFFAERHTVESTLAFTTNLDFTNTPPTNSVPTVENVNIKTAYNTPIAGNVVGKDADNDKLTYSLGTAPTKGTATVDATTGAWTYTPNAGISGTDTFTIVVTDGKGGTATATVAVEVASPALDTFTINGTIRDFCFKEEIKNNKSVPILFMLKKLKV